MEQGGLIKGYILNLDHAKLGHTIKAFVTIKIGFAQMQNFKKKLPQIKEVNHCYRVTGDDCMIMEVLLRDNAHLVAFLDEMAQYGITKTSIILNDLMEK